MLHSVVIEIRQHLCCANVFLKFKQPLIDFESLKITVNATKIKLQNPIGKTEIAVNKYFSILAGTFSNLIVDAENASFRVSIEDVKILETDEKYRRDCLQINLAENDEVSVICSNCNSTLAAEQKYDKIREFPSGAIDVSEFFCHHGPNYKDVLIPSKKDVFYGFLFIVINVAVIEESIRRKENHIYCKRCLKYLGESMFNNSAAKLWCDSIRFYVRDKILEIFALDDKSKIYKLMLKAIDETSLPSPEPLLRNIHFTKVILKAYFPNRQQQFLLVQILEKHLPILKKQEFETSKENENTFELQQGKAFKLLYRLILQNEETSDKETSGLPPILEYWQHDINILKINISPYLFSVLTKELNKNIKVLPAIYRLSTDDFLSSYIFY